MSILWIRIYRIKYLYFCSYATFLGLTIWSGVSRVWCPSLWLVSCPVYFETGSWASHHICVWIDLLPLLLPGYQQPEQMNMRMYSSQEFFILWSWTEWSVHNNICCLQLQTGYPIGGQQVDIFKYLLSSLCFLRSFFGFLLLLFLGFLWQGLPIFPEKKSSDI